MAKSKANFTSGTSVKSTLANIFRAGELRKKLLYTLLILIIFRLGAAIPVPFVNLNGLQGLMGGSEGYLGYINVITGGALSQATIFAMSITPYINATIIIQLLTVAIPALERLQKEGEEGRKVIGRITRYISIGLALVQSVGYYFVLKSHSNNGVPALFHPYLNTAEGWFSLVVIVTSFVAGTALIVWMGERITDKGIGNGISILLFGGIISRLPEAAVYLIERFKAGQYVLVPLIVVLFLGIIVFVTIMSTAERRVPVTYSKRVVGRKMYGGQNSHIPIKLNMSGVMPIIFASSLLSIPTLINQFVNVDQTNNPIWYAILHVFDYDSWIYAILYFLLIIGFNYFYVAIQYNPIEISNNLRRNNGAIPGIRPGKSTSDYLHALISRITLAGALFLGVMAILPIIVQQFTGVQLALGGTSALIIVGVAIETMRALESQTTMRTHKGFLE
jgi:preprotein translocase, SecY subunit